jgi:predicted Zn-dependent protease
MKRLCDLNLLDDEPAPWLERAFYSHPAPRRRIEAARAFAESAPSSRDPAPAS